MAGESWRWRVHKFTGHSKTELVQRLIVGVEQQRVLWPSTWDVLTAEMRRFEYAISPSGGITYDAPSGYHDDSVMALALANHRRWETESCGRMLRIVAGLTAVAPGAYGGWAGACPGCDVDAVGQMLRRFRQVPCSFRWQTGHPSTFSPFFNGRFRGLRVCMCVCLCV